MPEGDPSDLPSPPKFVDGWRISKSDQVLYMRSEPFDVPSFGTVDYQHFVVDPGWDEDKYIRAAEARPDNQAVVQHILVYILSSREGRRRRGPKLGSVLVGYAPGSMPVDLDSGVALKVPAGSKMLFQMYYTPNGYPQEDRSYAGVKFVDKADVKQEIKEGIAVKPRFRIPPQADNHVVRASHRVRQDEMLVAKMPHMHLRGKSFKYEATYPDGTKEVLLNVPNYDFN